MSELTNKLTAAAEQHKGSDLGGLLQWAVLHIQSQDDALSECRAELEVEESERRRLENVLHSAKKDIQDIINLLQNGPVSISLSRDHAPYINIMAHHGVAPYAKKSRVKK